MPVGVIVAEAPTGHVIRANRYAQTLLGSAIGGSADDLAPFELIDEHGRTLEPVDRPLARAVHEGLETCNERIELCRSDGTRLTVAASAAPIRDDDGEIVAAVALFEDISSRAVRERADRDFVANAAHELRTPLAAIASAIEVLAGAARRTLPAERDLFLGHIERESNRLPRLARALLLLARVQTRRRGAPRLEIVSLRPLLDDVAAATRPARGVSVSVRCPPDARRTRRTRELIEQALVNLATNAARYTSARLDHALARERTRSASVDRGRRHRLAASRRRRDERMFERFFRAGARDAGASGSASRSPGRRVEAIGGTHRDRHRRRQGDDRAPRAARRHSWRSRERPRSSSSTTSRRSATRSATRSAARASRSSGSRPARRRCARSTRRRARPRRARPDAARPLRDRGLPPRSARRATCRSSC